MEAQRPTAMRESTAGRGIEEARVTIGPMAGVRWLLGAGRLPGRTIVLLLFQRLGQHG